MEAWEKERISELLDRVKSSVSDLIVFFEHRHQTKSAITNLTYDNSKQYLHIIETYKLLEID